MTGSYLSSHNEQFNKRPTRNSSVDRRHFEAQRSKRNDQRPGNVDQPWSERPHLPLPTAANTGRSSSQPGLGRKLYDAAAPQRKINPIINSSRKGSLPVKKTRFRHDAEVVAIDTDDDNWRELAVDVEYCKAMERLDPDGPAKLQAAKQRKFDFENGVVKPELRVSRRSLADMEREQMKRKPRSRGKRTEKGRMSNCSPM